MTGQDWKKIYFQALIEELKPSGDVLQVGFRDKTAANLIQSHHPTVHTIIEPDPDLFKEAKKWSKDYHNVHIIFNTWEKALEKLSSYDAIFFDAAPLPVEAERHPSLEDAVVALESGKKLLSDIEKDFPKLTKITYSDQDLEELISQTDPSHYPNLVHFLEELHHNGQITKEQFDRLIESKNLPKRKETTAIGKIDEVQDSAFFFFQKCVDRHMKKGSRFTCFSTDPTSKYENPIFFEKVITNPNLDFQEYWIDLPSSAPFPKALIIKIEKII